MTDFEQGAFQVVQTQYSRGTAPPLTRENRELIVTMLRRVIADLEDDAIAGPGSHIDARVSRGVAETMVDASGSAVPYGRRVVVFCDMSLYPPEPT